jgi:hypothetical protein
MLYNVTLVVNESIQVVASYVTDHIYKRILNEVKTAYIYLVHLFGTLLVLSVIFNVKLIICRNERMENVI